MQDKDDTANRLGSDGAGAPPDVLSVAATEPVISDIQKPNATPFTNPFNKTQEYTPKTTVVQSSATATEGPASTAQHTSSPASSSQTPHSLGFTRFKPLLIAAFFILGLGLAGFLGYRQLSSQGQQNAISADPATAYDIQKLDLQDLADTSSLGLATTQSLSVNGQLRTNNSLVLAPTTQPSATSATAGQLYYDRDGNILAYYNGTQFVDVASADQLEALRIQLQTVAGNIPIVPTLPADLATLGAANAFQSLNTFSGGLATSSLAASSLSVAGSASLQGSLIVTGNTTLGPTTASSLVLSSPLAVGSGGTGASSLTANGVVIANGSSPLTTATYASGGQCLMSPVSGSGAPVFDVCPGGVGSGVNSLNGLAGNLVIANATGIGTTITLDDASTTTKGIASFNTTNFSVTAGVVNTIQNIGTTASPTFAGVTAGSLTGNGAGVTNVNAVSLSGNNASYFTNASNISTGTLADARLSASVTLAGNVFNGAGQLVQLNGLGQLPALSGALLTNLNAASITTGSLADARLSANVALLGAVTANFTGTLQRAGNTVCDASNNCGYLTGAAANGSYIQLQATTPGTAQTGNFNISGTGRAAALYQNGSQVCDVSGNCTGLGGELTGSGTAGTLAVFTGTGNTLGDSLLSQTGLTVTVGGTLAATALTGNGSGVTNVNASQLNGQAASYYLNATNISAGTLADARLSVNVPLLNSATNNFTGALQQGGNAVCNASNNCNYLTQLTANDIYLQLQATTPGTAQIGNFNISGAGRAATLYQNGSQVCDVSGNCTGLGGELTGSGTPGTLAVFTGTGASLGDSILSQAATTVTVAGTLSATALTGNGAGVTSVNAAQLNGQAASYYLNATNISSGTLADARLSTNVTVQGNIFNGANQLVQLDVSGQLPAVSGALVTSLNGSNVSSGTVADARLSANVALLNSAANFTGVLQHNGSTVCDISNNCGYLTGAAASGSYVELQSTTPGTAQTGHLNITGTVIAGSLYQGANQVCDTSGNCAGAGGGLVGSGTTGTIAKFTASGTLGNSILTENLTTVSVGGTLAATTLTGNGAGVTNVNASQLNGQAASYYLNATNISAGTLADGRLSANVALLGAVTTNFTGTLQRAGNTVCDNSNNCGYLTGAAADGDYIQLQATTPGTAQTGNFNITGAGRATSLYQNGNQVCDTSGNCTGIGGEITGSGTPGTLAVFTGTGNTLGDSILTQALTTVTVAGTLSATNLTGNGSGVTNVNASQLNGQAASYYLNATNLSAGTLADARLSANVALLDAITSNFTGTLQQNGNAVCNASNNCNYLTQLTANDIYLQLQATTPGTAQTGNFNISGAGRAASLYQNGNQVCDTGGNCVGLGGGLTGSGTPGALAKFTGTGTLGDSIMTESLTTITVGGTLAATTLTGNGAGVTNVNAAQLNGQAASYYLNATNISTGTLADGRLSANVALLDAVTNNFTGTVQGAALNATGSLQLNGVNINTAGTLSNVAYLTQANTFSAANTFSTSITTPLVQSAALAALTLTGNAASTFNTTAGDLTLQAGSGTISLGTTTALTAANALTITGGSTLVLQSTGINAVSLDSGTTGAINIGTSANAKTLTIGNSTGATAVYIQGGSGGINMSGVTSFSTGTTAAPGLTFTANSAVGLLTASSFGANDALRAVANNPAVGFQVQNRHASGMSGIEYVDSAGTTRALTGFYNGSIQDFKISNYTAGGYLSFMTANITRLQIANSGAVAISGAATVSGNLIANNGLYTGAGAGTLRISSTGALSNVSIPTASTVTVGSANAFGILYTNSSNVLQFANINGAYASTTKCLMSDGTTGLGFGTCPGGGGGGGWGLTGSDAAGSILGSNATTTANFVISSRPNNVGATSANASYISFSGEGSSNPNRIIISGNANSNSPQGGGSWASSNTKDYFRIQDSSGQTAFAVQGAGGPQQVFMYLAAGSSVGVQGRVCSTLAAGGSGMATIATCTTSGTDLAESYNSTQSLEPGDIVSTDPDNYPNVLRSDRVQQDNLIGIVSTEPDYVMGESKTPNGYPIALNGRVPTKVNGEGGPILPGDKITSSSVPGVGKKATSRGMIVGTALTGYSGTGQGVIEVFVHLDYYEPPQIDMLQANAANIGDLNVSGTATLQNLVVEGDTTVYSIMVKGHIITSSGQPVADVREAAGSGAMVTIDGNDTAGTIKITTGASGLMIGDLTNLTFSETYGKVPRIVMTGQDGVSVKASIYPSTKSLTGFTLQTDEALLPNVTYTFDYFIVE